MTTTTAAAPTTDPTPRLASFTATGRSTGSLSTAVEARQFGFVVAEPPSLGGTDEGANPIEYVLGALNGCVTVVVETVAAELGVAVDGVATEATGTLDIRGFAGTADVSPHFQTLTLQVTLTTAVAEAELGELKAQVLRRCPLFNLIRDAGVPVEETWVVRQA
ncbi:OsmC family protein [Georgenia phoenicis]|uniref:OsmC family protein n=1 Tax=unclassified Georgenia TaxID=2626815 RepID=UPI0039B01F5E